MTGKLKGASDSRRSARRRISGSAGSHLTSEEHERIAGEIQQYEEAEKSADAQLELLLEKKKQLEVRSPIKGQVVSWQIKERLFKRPVEKGQLLLTVANGEGELELDVMMPEDRMGFVMRAKKEKLEEAEREKAAGGENAANVDSRLDASYILATNPSARHHGKVIDIVPSAHVQGEEGNVVLVKVSLDKNDHEQLDLRQGATVTAKIDCGTASIGYCWFHDLIAFVEKKWFSL